MILPYTSILLQSCFYSALWFQTSPRCSALKSPSRTCSARSSQPGGWNDLSMDAINKRKIQSCSLSFKKKTYQQSFTFIFFGWSILLKMSFAWDSRAAKLEGLGGGDDSFAFFAFFFPPSLTLGTFGGLGALGIFGGLGGFGGLEAFFRPFSLLGEGTWAGETGSSGSEWVDGGSSTGTLMLGSLLMAFVAFYKRSKIWICHHDESQ